MTENGDHPAYDTCGAARKQTGQPCTRPAGWGTEHPGYGACKLHGGCTPTHIASARTTMAHEAAEHFGLPRDIDPQQALIEELHRTAGLVEFYQAKAAEDPDALLVKTMFGQQPNVWIKQMEAERRHFKDVAATCVKLGLDERRVALAEEQGKLLARIIGGILAELGVADLPEAPAVVRRHLMLAAG